MKVTLDHPASKHGFPVILDDDGKVMDEAAGIAAVLERAGVTVAEFAAFCDILPDTVAKYGRGRRAPGQVLNALGLVLKSRGEVIGKSGQKPQFSDTELEVLALREKGLSYAAIGKKLGIVRQRAHQIAQAAEGKLAL